MIVRRLFILFLYSICISLQAQTAVWQMLPVEADEIIRMNRNLYKITNNGKFGFIRSDGTQVSPVEYDNIIGYYEQKAIVTRNDGHGERVCGCLTEDGDFHSYSTKYYTLEGQKFFSDNVLSVVNENGKKGYIDERGNAVVGFDGKYDIIKPFVDGYAAVYKNSKYQLIDKNGTPVLFKFKTIGELYGGTNAYNGKVYVWDTNGKFYTYDLKKGGTCEPTKQPQSATKDYLFRFSSVTKLGKEIPYTTMVKRGVMGLEPKNREGLYGYIASTDTVLPYQFSTAYSFEDGYAIVKINGKTGILKYVEGDKFSVSVPITHFKFYSVGEVVTGKVNLSIPNAWANKQLTITLKDKMGTVIPATTSGNAVSFTLHPTATSNITYVMTISGEELKLKIYEFTLSFTKKERCAECGKDKDECPGHVKKTTETKSKEEKCPTCGKPISKCKFNGIH